MGREIRRVPPNWEHPKESKYNFLKQREETEYIPMFDECFRVAIEQWIAGYEKWKRKEHSWQKIGDYTESSYWEYEGSPPNPSYYRPEWEEGEATWYQLYQTVSEGSPVSPPFATQQELADYLAVNGDFWDQNRRAEGRGSIMDCSPWGKERAEHFVFGDGWAPSFVAFDGKLMSGVEAMTQDKP